MQQLSEIFGCHYHSVSRWFCRHRQGGVRCLRRRKARGADRLLHRGHLRWLRGSLTKVATEYGFATPLWNTRLVRLLLKREQGVALDRSTVWRYLVRLGLSSQKPEPRYTQQDKKLVAQWIHKKWPAIQRWRRENRAILYFEDEAGVSNATYYKTSQGEWEGLAVDLWKESAAALGWKYVWQEFPGDESLRKVAAGEVDVVVSKVVLAPEREALMDFSAPFLTPKLAMVWVLSSLILISIFTATVIAFLTLGHLNSRMQTG